MSVSAIIGGFSSYSKLRGSNDEDWVDRVNHLYTVLILVLFAIFISGGQYVGNPIECWCPAHFTGSYVAYTKSFCWVKNTYHIPMDNTIPLENHKRDSEELTFYQWVPIILLFMAFLFKAPSILWRIFNGGSGLNLEKIVNLTTDTQIGSPEKREETLRHISIYIDRWLETHRQYHWNTLIRARERVSKLCCCLCSKQDGTYLTGLYIFIKLVYVVNVVCQFFLLNAFMGEWYNLYGFEVMADLYNNQTWKDSPRFPKITLCDFDVRQLTNIQQHTVQCVLPMNLFNEKIFIFLWFWFVLVAILTFGNFVFWIWRVLFKTNRVRYAKKYLKLFDEVQGDEYKQFAKKFADQYLRDDGIFVLRLIAKNSNDILLPDLVLNLWRIFKSKPMIKKKEHSQADDKSNAESNV